MHAQNIVHQGPVIGAIGRLAARVLWQRLRKPEAGAAPAVPGPVFEATLKPRPESLVRDYLRWCKADAGAYRGQLPGHLFPQWGFPLLSRTLEGLPYPLDRVLNGGCRLELNAPLPMGETLLLSAQLMGIDDDGRRVVLHQRLITETRSTPNAVVSHLFAIVPLGSASKEKRERALVPSDAREIGDLKLSTRAGFEFACLTGDFNPVHWVAPYGKAAGFGGTILHGFATLARAIERLNRNVLSGDVSKLSTIDVKFTRPLRLPARVRVFHQPGALFVGEAPSAPAFLTGSYETRNQGSSNV